MGAAIIQSTSDIVAQRTAALFMLRYEPPWSLRSLTPSPLPTWNEHERNRYHLRPAWQRRVFAILLVTPLPILSAHTGLRLAPALHRSMHLVLLLLLAELLLTRATLLVHAPVHLTISPGSAHLRIANTTGRSLSWKLRRWLHLGLMWLRGVMLLSIGLHMVRGRLRWGPHAARRIVV